MISLPRWSWAIAALLVVVVNCVPTEQQRLLLANLNAVHSFENPRNNERPLHGRFLHITGEFVSTCDLGVIANASKTFIQIPSTNTTRRRGRAMHATEVKDRPGSWEQRHRTAILHCH